MTSATPAQVPTSVHGPRTPTRVQRHPVASFALLALPIGWAALATPLIANLPSEPFLLVFLFAALLGPALIVTRLAGGPGAVRALLSRALIWRFGVGRWAVIVFAMPALTVGLAAASGTLYDPAHGWASVLGQYLFEALILGALLGNLWEETAWGGFAQSRLMARHGLLVGALLTAPLFAAIHIPMQFTPGWTWSSVAIGSAIVFAAAPFYRYLLGMHLLDTRGSILAIAVQHASWNAAGDLDGVRGEWQVLVAAVLLTLFIAVGRRLFRPRSHAVGRAAEKAVATAWLSPTAAISPAPVR